LKPVLWRARGWDWRRITVLQIADSVTSVPHQYPQYLFPAVPVSGSTGTTSPHQDQANGP
jgi:hypothetical protein